MTEKARRISSYKKHYTVHGKMRKVHVFCTRCGRKQKIVTNDKRLWTAEARESYVCIFCRPIVNEAE